MKKSLLILLVLFAGSLNVFSKNNGCLIKSSILNSKNPIKDSVAIDNEYIRVMRNSALLGSAGSAEFGTRVIVALEKLKIKSSKGVRVLKRGEFEVFLSDESYKAPKGEYFEVAFRLNHPPLILMEEYLEPVKNTIVYEDNQFRIFEEKLAPWDTRPLHSHAQRAVVKLNPAYLTDPRYRPAGTTKGSLQTPNTIKYAEPITHVVQNISDVPLFNLVIEFKIPGN